MALRPTMSPAPAPALSHHEIVAAGRPYFEARLGLVCLVLVAGVAYLEFHLPPQVRLTFLYLLIIALGAWLGGSLSGVGVALISSVAFGLRETDATEGGRLTGAGLWNTGMQTAIYLSAALLLSALRRVTGNLKRLAGDRAAELKREMLDHTQTEEQLRKTMQQLRQLAENITDVFWMRNAGETRMGYVSPAYEKVWGRSCRDLYQSPQLWTEAIHPEDRERVSRTTHDPGNNQAYDDQYRIVQPGGTVRWIRDRAFPVCDSAGRVVRMVGIAEDITERRRLEREILEVSDREQARIGQDLHDSLCQKLVSLAFDTQAMAERLAMRSAPEGDAARRMTGLVDDMITEARAVARGLFPVQLELDGLGGALEQLAILVGTRWNVNCRLECPAPVSLRHLAVATHLYRIAQEAVTNAVKHGRASRIVIGLYARERKVELCVTDNGCGLPSSPSAGGGMGLHTMEYRARTIGGTLSLARGPEGGTVVRCTAPLSTPEESP